METIKRLRDRIAIEYGFEGYAHMLFTYKDFPKKLPTGKFMDILEQINAEYARQACEKKRELCAEAAETYVEPHYTGEEIYTYVDRDSILNAPLVTEI